MEAIFRAGEREKHAINNALESSPMTCIKHHIPGLGAVKQYWNPPTKLKPMIDRKTGSAEPRPTGRLHLALVKLTQPIRRTQKQLSSVCPSGVLTLDSGTLTWKWSV